MRGVVRIALVGIAALAACDRQQTLVSSSLNPPANLTYELEPSGTPGSPSGILLSWDAESSPDLASYRVYSRASTSDAYGLRGETTSNTFHDNGIPHLQYFVTAVDVNGNESLGSNVVTVDERLMLEAPTTLSTTSLDGAIALSWSDNAYLDDPADFKWYRVYSASYTLGDTLCGNDWALEGTTVSPDFIASAMTNGVSRCFAVSAIAQSGTESLWSPVREDTPRPDARNVLLYPLDADTASSGFRFWDDVNGDGIGEAGELGIVESGTATDADFYVYRDPSDSSLWLVPQFSGTSVALYSNAPVADLTSIDVAPDSGYSRNMIEAVPGYAYVFQIVEGATVRYGAVRITDVGHQYLILDWSFQTDPGNPELVAHGGRVIAPVTAGPVPGAR